MASHKIFFDDNEPSKMLEVYRNSKNRCFIHVGDIFGTEIDSFRGWVTLDSDDLTELISELQYIKKEIDKIEENG